MADRLAGHEKSDHWSWSDREQTENSETLKQFTLVGSQINFYIVYWQQCKPQTYKPRQTTTTTTTRRRWRSQLSFHAIDSDSFALVGFLTSSHSLCFNSTTTTPLSRSTLMRLRSGNSCARIHRSGANKAADQAARSLAGWPNGRQDNRRPDKRAAHLFRTRLNQIKALLMEAFQRGSKRLISGWEQQSINHQHFGPSSAGGKLKVKWRLRCENKLLIFFAYDANNGKRLQSTSSASNR